MPSSRRITEVDLDVFVSSYILAIKFVVSSGLDYNRCNWQPETCTWKQPVYLDILLLFAVY
jgi:hypothetical protein